VNSKLRPWVRTCFGAENLEIYQNVVETCRVKNHEVKNSSEVVHSVKSIMKQITTFKSFI